MFDISERVNFENIELKMSVWWLCVSSEIFLSSQRQNNTKTKKHVCNECDNASIHYVESGWLMVMMGLMVHAYMDPLCCTWLCQREISCICEIVTVVVVVVLIGFIHSFIRSFVRSFVGVYSFMLTITCHLYWIIHSAEQNRSNAAVAEPQKSFENVMRMRKKKKQNSVNEWIRKITTNQHINRSTTKTSSTICINSNSISRAPTIKMFNDWISFLFLLYLIFSAVVVVVVVFCT